MPGFFFFFFEKERERGGTVSKRDAAIWVALIG